MAPTVRVMVIDAKRSGTRQRASEKGRRIFSPAEKSEKLTAISARCSTMKDSPPSGSKSRSSNPRGPTAIPATR